MLRVINISNLSLILVFFSFVIGPKISFGQEKLVFLNNYQQAKEFALLHGKPTLYYISYDSTCYECTKMDSILNSPEISNYLYENYIAVKLDFLKPDGQYIFKKHNLRTLPTLLVLDTSQMQAAVMEPDMKASDILRYFRYIREPKDRDIFYNYALDQKNIPFDKKKMEALYRSYSMMYGPFPDENSEKLSNQAVVHFRLRSGFAHEFVKKYLDAQVQLLTIKNLYFIMNFLDDTRSVGFKFLLTNRKSFDEAFGIEEVDKKINDLIYKRLYMIQPEPDYHEAFELLSLVSNIEVEKRAYEYLIIQKLNKKKIPDYLGLQRKYISRFATRDHERMIQMIKVYMENVAENYNTPYYIDVAKTAKKLSPDNLEYHIILTKLYLKDNDRKNAMAEAISALSLAKKLQAPIEPILELLLETQSLPEMKIDLPSENPKRK